MINLKGAIKLSVVANAILFSTLSYSEIIMERKNNDSLYSAMSVSDDLYVTQSFFHLTEFDANISCDSKSRARLAMESGEGLLDTRSKVTGGSIERVTIEGNPGRPATYHRIDLGTSVFDPWIGCWDWETYPQVIGLSGSPDGVMYFGNHGFGHGYGFMYGGFQDVSLDEDNTLLSMEYQATSPDPERGPIVEVNVEHNFRKGPNDESEKYELAIYYLDSNFNWTQAVKAPFKRAEYGVPNDPLTLRTALPYSGPVQVRILLTGQVPRPNIMTSTWARTELSIKNMQFWTETCVVDEFAGGCKVF